MILKICPIILTIIVVATVQFYCKVGTHLFRMDTTGQWLQSATVERLEKRLSPDEEIPKNNFKIASKGDVVSSRIEHSDPWMGLDPAAVGEQWPGLLLNNPYVLRPFIDPDDNMAHGMGNKPRYVYELTEAGAEERFTQLIMVNHINCSNRVRLGNEADGGWEVCISDPYKPTENCLVYSFGIGNDFSFDDAIAKKYGCRVHSFDPTMDIPSHKRSSLVTFHDIGLGGKNLWISNKTKWHHMTLAALLDRRGHLHTIIDYLKMDIEHHEWAVIKEMLVTGVLKNVKQLSLEIHRRLKDKSLIKDFYRFYAILLGLERIGFRRYHHHTNPACVYTSKFTKKRRSQCYELYYININFLKKENQPFTSSGGNEYHQVIFSLTEIVTIYLINIKFVILTMIISYIFYVIHIYYKNTEFKPVDV